MRDTDKKEDAFKKKTENKKSALLLKQQLEGALRLRVITRFVLLHMHLLKGLRRTKHSKAICSLLIPALGLQRKYAGRGTGRWLHVRGTEL